LKSAERDFFRVLGIDPPCELYQVYDLRDCYWAAEEKGQHIHIKYAKDTESGRIYSTDFVHRYRKDKGEHIEIGNLTIFKVGYSLRYINYIYYKVFHNNRFVSDYDNFRNCIPSPVNQT